MRNADDHPTPSPRPNFIASTRRPLAAPGESILARLDRDGDGAALRRSGRRRKTTLAAVVVMSLALSWMLAGPGQDDAPGARDAPVLVATPAPAEPVAQPLPATVVHSTPETRAASDPQSLEPVPVLPMLADVVEKAPAASAPRPATRPQRTTAQPLRARAHSKPAGVAADSGVETDVAFLSAILIHAPRHSAERARAEAKCKADNHCPLDGPLPALLKAVE